MKKTGFNVYVYDFSVDYNATDVDDILDIHKYLMKKTTQSKMKIFVFVKKLFFVGLAILSSFPNAYSLSSISINNQECKTRPEVVNANEDESVFFPFSIKTSKYSGSCNNINYPYTNICVLDVVKNLNVKVFNLISRTNDL